MLVSLLLLELVFWLGQVAGEGHSLRADLVSGCGEITYCFQLICLTKLKSSKQAQQWTSEPYYPSPWMNPRAEGWEHAYIQAKEFVSQLTLLEKVNLTTGVG